MNPQKIMGVMQDKCRELSAMNEEMITLADAMSVAKRDYAIGFAKKILELKEAKHPATLILDLARGDEKIAQLRLEKDIAKEVFNACRQSIKNLHIGIETGRSCLTWQRAELNAPNA